MGCTTSKESVRKRPARESWYAPVSRSTSAPIRYVADIEADGHCSPSTPHNFIEDTTPFRQCNQSSSTKSTLASMLQQEDREYAGGKDDHVTDNNLLSCYIYRRNARESPGNDYEPRKRVAVSKMHSRFNSLLIPVSEVSECDTGDVDNNTWELLKGLDDVVTRRKSPLIRPKGSDSVFEKSQSFNEVQGLDSCFTEFSTPAWQSYFSEQEKKREKEPGKPTSFEEISFSMEQVESNSTSPARSPLKSPLRTPQKTPVRSPLRSPLKSPLRSPLKSFLMGSDSPLFDPALLAKFEQAVDATVLPHGDLLTSSKKEESITLSSSSLFNDTTWGLSETSSEGENQQSILKENPATNNVMPSWDKNRNTLCHLDQFKVRCPPKGEDKVVLYFTSLRGVRKTYEDCCVLRRILQGLGVRVDERDVWMHSKFREELTELLDSKRLQVPRLFIKGRYIGGADEVCLLHEDGALIGLMEGMRCFGTYQKACEGCTDMRFVPCFTCHGGCKVLDDLGQVVRCSECNENGLVLCPLCS